MKSQIALVLALALSLTACRKLPYYDLFNPPEASESLPMESTAIGPKPGLVADVERPTDIDRSARVIVLGYHRFVDTVRHPDTEITTAEFEAQMQDLKDRGIAVISMEDFNAWRHEAKSIPVRSALITIDDGYNSAYEVAWPILRKFGYPFTLFVYTDYIRGGPKSGGGSLAWAQLQEMRDGGISIQSHTVSHADLRRLKGGTAGASYEEWLHNELQTSKETLETRLGIKVTALALPYGLANDRVRQAALEGGYEMLFTVNGQKISFDTPAVALGRYMVRANQPKLFATATAFEGGPSANGVATIAPACLHPQPAEGALIADTDPMIQADLTTLLPIDPASVSLRLSGTGEVAAQFDPGTAMLVYQAHGLMPNKYTVILAAKSDGRKIESRWSFTVDSPGSDPSPLAPAHNR
jgi:peptidoglycan/xylan/chitin deacetylase (PgdA/CDA1 family)